MVEARVERRLAAILATDVVGYSRLVEQDEAGTLAAVRALRREAIDPPLAEHKGRIVKLMGDGALVEFASVVDAVACAVAVQKAVAAHQASVPDARRIVLRIGVNLGDVVVDGDDLLGDGVNVAARLEALAEPGGVCVSASVCEEVRGKLAASFEDIGEQTVKNISRPIRAYRVRSGTVEDSGLPARPLPSLPKKPSIAVLPFQNMSGDHEQDYFADGVVEELITELARLRWLFVIARNSSFAYKGQAADVKRVGRELGVRYILEGSVRRAGDRVRITGQLVDASTGTHLWAGRFDGELADIFELQDQVTASVIGAIAPKLEQAEIERAKRKPTESLDAYDYFLRGMAAFYRLTKPANGEALALFARAIELDPEFAAAHAMAARCYLQRKWFGWVDDKALEIGKTRWLARRAIDLGWNDAVALGYAGLALAVVVGDLHEGVALLDRALALNQNLAWAWNFSALTKVFQGEPKAAIEHAARAMRLSPQDTQMFAMQMATAWGHFFLGRDDEASSWAEAALRQQPNFFVATCVAAAASALAGKTAEASKSMARLRQIDPALRLSSLHELLPFSRPEDLARWAEGLRRAGLPE